MTTVRDDKRVDELIAMGRHVVDQARAKGAEVAEALVRQSEGLSAKVRMGDPELIEEAGSLAAGLRVIIEGRSATTYTSDPSSSGLQTLVDDAIELASLSSTDESAVPPDPSLLAQDFADLQLFDPASASIDAKVATERALAAEAAARDLDPRITNSEGATFGRTMSAAALVTSGGFAGGFRSSFQSIVVQPVADDEGGKKRNGSFWDAKRFVDALQSDEEVGREAARRTLAKLGTRKVPSCEVPVVFDPDTGRALLSLLFSCVSGGAIYRRASYLCDREGETIASPLVTIVDDPLSVRGPGSRPFDGEGLASRKNVVVEAGALKTYLLDTYSAKKLGKESTASASRGIGGRPSVSHTNLILLPGERDPEDIVAEVDQGLYVTSMMGFGFNAATGDFSRGAEGFWIEKGKRTYPVGEVTVSLNFNDLWKRIDAIGNDPDERSTLVTPTFRVSKMTVAGS